MCIRDRLNAGPQVLLHPLDAHRVVIDDGPIVGRRVFDTQQGAPEPLCGDVYKRQPSSRARTAALPDRVTQGGAGPRSINRVGDQGSTKVHGCARTQFIQQSPAPLSVAERVPQGGASCRG